MGIGRIDGKSPPVPGVRPAALEGKPSPQQEHTWPVSQEDTASVAFGSMVQRLVAGAVESHAVDPVRLQVLRQAIDDGTYTIDPEQIAQRMVDMERALWFGLPWT